MSGEDEGDDDHTQRKPMNRNLDSVVHVYEHSSMRNQLSFCISRLKEHKPIKITGLGPCIGKVIMMVEILKERLGWLH